MKYIGLALAFSLLLLAGCDSEPYATTPPPETTQNHWRITKLFEHDGCAAYYADGPGSGFSEFKYVVCNSGNSVRTEWQQPRRSGKFTSYETVSVDTETRQ